VSGARFSAVVDGTSVSVWTGTRRECESYIEGAHANSVNPYLSLSPAGCCCGPNRKRIVIPANETTYERVGCSTCDQWDEPPRLRDRWT
tara:strand:- start:726 stop:992 length:267 start_codon:yes stop_codon:yes gene_type:complete